MRRRPARTLRAQLGIAFAGLAVLTAVVLGLVLVPILAAHYSTAEGAYLATGAERAVRDLSEADWRDPVELQAVVATLAQVAQSRVKVTAAGGEVAVTAGPPLQPSQPGGPQPLPNPLDAGLLGGAFEPWSLPRSAETVTLPVLRHEATASVMLGTVTLDLPPDYSGAALIAVIRAWALASLIGVLAAALAGLLLARRLARPLVALTDASERMAAGDLAARANVGGADEMGRLAGSFNAMAQRTEETVTGLRRFVGDAAHELGTPLTALQADLELAAAKSGDGDVHRLIERASLQVDRLADISRELLQLARLEGGAAGRLEPTDLVAVVRDVADANASRLDQAALELRAQLPTEPVVVLGDQERLRTAVAYLLDNAVKFTPSYGVITIGLTSGEGLARLVVADTGIGIPPDDLPSVFERFHRGRNASRIPGSGLGLAVVRATVELHGGSVAACSAPGRTAITITLPTT